VAVRAPYFALVDLSSEHVPGNRRAGESAHVGAFVAQMIEVEKVDVGFAAVHARVITQVPPQPGPEFDRTMISPDSGFRDLFFSIASVPLVRVCPLTQ
jgi:hypothetical protein